MLIGYHSSKQAERISTTSLFIQSDVKAEVCIFSITGLCSAREQIRKTENYQPHNRRRAHS